MKPLNESLSHQRSESGTTERKELFFKDHKTSHKISSLIMTHHRKTIKKNQVQILQRQIPLQRPVLKMEQVRIRQMNHL